MCETELKLQEVNASTTLDKDHTPADSHGVRTRGVNTPGDYERGTYVVAPNSNARHFCAIHAASTTSLWQRGITHTLKESPSPPAL